MARGHGVKTVSVSGALLQMTQQGRLLTWQISYIPWPVSSWSFYCSLLSLLNVEKEERQSVNWTCPLPHTSTSGPAEPLGGRPLLLGPASCLDYAQRLLIKYRV